MKEIIVPRLIESNENVTFIEWKKSDRDFVNKGEVICLVETMKALIEVEAPYSGFLRQTVDPPLELKTGDLIGYLLESKEESEKEEYIKKRPVLQQNGTGRIFTKKAQELIRRFKIHGDSIAKNGIISAEDVFRHISSDSKVILADGIEPVRTTKKRVVIIGGGNYTYFVTDVLRKNGYCPIGILDDDISLLSAQVGSLKVIGNIAAARELKAGSFFDEAIITVTSQGMRQEIYNGLKALGIKFANAIHPTAYIDSDVEIGEGNLLGAFVHIGSCARIGNNSLFSSGCNIEHHCTVGDGNFWGPYCSLSGGVTFGSGSILGTGIFVEGNVIIGDNVRISSGEVINADLKDGWKKTKRAMTR